MKKENVMISKEDLKRIEDNVMRRIYTVKSETEELSRMLEPKEYIVERGNGLVSVFASYFEREYSGNEEYKRLLFYDERKKCIAVINGFDSICLKGVIKA